MARIVECRTYEAGPHSVHAVQFQPTERPIEDRFSFHFEANENRLILGVYDGHGGTAAVEVVSTRLPLNLLRSTSSNATQVFEELDNSIMNTFIDGHSIFHWKSSNWVQNAEAVKSGSTALVCDIDLKGMAASIANAGDCRLLICHTGESNKPTVRYQTSDLNGTTPSEQDRLRSEHPNEELIVVSGRLFGRLMSTRGFGDGYYKLPCKGVLGKMRHKKYIDILSSVEQPGKVPMNLQYESYFYGYRTPPYITARPEMDSQGITPGDVVIIASDGLWDRISSQEAASVVLHARSLGVSNLASHLLQFLRETRPPGDDVTIVILDVSNIADLH